MIVFAAYFVAGKLGQATTGVRSNNLGPVWPAYGVALAAILLCGYRIWPAVALGVFVIAVSSPEPYLTALGQTAGATLAALLGTFLLRRIAEFDNSLARLRDVLALIVLGALGSAIVSASIGTLVLHASHIHSFTGLGSAWLIYWLGDSTGVLLVTPLALAFPDLLRIRNWSRWAEFCCLVTILVAICAIVFGDLAIVPVRMIAFAVLPLVMWAAIRFGVGGAGLSIFLVATVATVETALGSGSFASSTPFINGVQLDAFFAVLSLTGLTFAAVYSERELAQREREQSLREQVAMEVRLQDQELLRASEERLRLAQEAARIGSFDWNIATDVNTWTPELEALYGVPPGTFGGTDAAFENLVHPDDRARLNELRQSTLNAGRSVSGEWRVIWPDGSVHWMAGHWKVLTNESGQPSRMVGINMDITERKQAEDALRASEERLRLATQAGRMYAYDWDVTTDEVLRSPEHAKILGHADPLRPSHQQFADRIHPDDRHKFLAAITGLTPENPIGEVTYRALASDGTLVWLKSNGRGFFDAEGRLLRVIGMVADVTNVKRAEETLGDMTRKLIQAQEQERARIGRELHDDVNQRLAMLAVELEQVKENPSDVGIRVQELRRQVIDISNDVQALSHELHSSKLEYLGVAAGIKSWCEEFSERQRMEIVFKNEVGSILPLEIGVCLFRVLQEALHNAAKHSTVKHVEVKMAERQNEIHLIVRDSGSGFDLELAKQGRGLGLTSMQERVRLVNGTISIESKPMSGTTIHVRIPFRRTEIANEL